VVNLSILTFFSCYFCRSIKDSKMSKAAFLKG